MKFIKPESEKESAKDKRLGKAIYDSVLPEIKAAVTYLSPAKLKKAHKDFTKNKTLALDLIGEIQDEMMRTKSLALKAWANKNGPISQFDNPILVYRRGGPNSDYGLSSVWRLSTDQGYAKSLGTTYTKIYITLSVDEKKTVGRDLNDKNFDTLADIPGGLNYLMAPYSGSVWFNLPQTKDNYLACVNEYSDAAAEVVVASG